MKNVYVIVLILFGLTAVFSVIKNPPPSFATYKNKVGYSVEYPKNWSIANCMEGIQLYFSADSDFSQSACDVPRAFREFTIVGPVPKEELALSEGTLSQSGVIEKSVELPTGIFKVFLKLPITPVEQRMLDSIKSK